MSESSSPSSPSFSTNRGEAARVRKRSRAFRGSANAGAGGTDLEAPLRREGRLTGREAGLQPPESTRKASLICRARTRLCALPLEHVVETMRPLPIEKLAGMPSFVRGLSVIRGIPVPVVDAGALFGTDEGAGSTRFVTLRTGQRQVALSVEEVLGVRSFPAESVADLPPLLRDGGSELISALGLLDADLLFVLRAGADPVRRGLAGARRWRNGDVKTASVTEVEQFRTIVAMRLGLNFDDTKLGFLADILERRVDAGGGISEAYLFRLERVEEFFRGELRAARAGAHSRGDLLLPALGSVPGLHGSGPSRPDARAVGVA